MRRWGPVLVRVIAVAAGGALLLAAERRWPLRRRTEPKHVRDTRNLAVAVTSALAAQLVERPLVERLARAVARRRWGLVRRLPVPGPVRVVLALVLLDWSFYGWHVLTHRIPWLWRFHLVHHADLDMDASTAIRFHGAEIALSVPWRAAQVALIGVDERTLVLWQRLVLGSILFHHSDLRLPVGLERALSRVVVTPRMHGIHHSIVREETDSNWSSGLTVWDWLHGTLRLDVPQDAVTIGLPAWRRPSQVTLGRLLRLPFEPQPPTWRCPDGTRPVREAAAGGELSGPAGGVAGTSSARHEAWNSST